MKKGGDLSRKPTLPLSPERKSASTRANKKFSLKVGLTESEAFAKISDLSSAEALKEISHSKSSDDEDSDGLNSGVDAQNSASDLPANPEPYLTEKEQQSVSNSHPNSIPEDNSPSSGKENPSQISSIFADLGIQITSQVPEDWAANYSLPGVNTSEFKPKLKHSSTASRKTPLDKPPSAPSSSSPSPREQSHIMADIKFEEKMMSFDDYIKKVEAKVKNLGRIIKRFKIADIQGYCS